MSSPLTGITVIELGHSVAAPYAGLILASLGAEVIKIERPGKGDDARAWGPPFVDGSSTMFNCLNRHKQSVEIDLKSAEGIAQIRRLTNNADVFLQNLRPEQADHLGLGANILRASNPALIYATISAFGDKGPLKDRPGYDPLMQAFAGLMSVTGEEGRPSIRSGTSMGDMGSGLWVVIGVLTALNTRNKTGEGSVVGTSLFETGLGWMLYHAPAYAISQKLPRKLGSGTFAIAPYEAFMASDGEIIIAAGNNNLFCKLADVLNEPNWKNDTRYATNADRVLNRENLRISIANIIITDTRAAWVEKLENQNIPCAPVQTIDQVIDHPQTHALDIISNDSNGSIYMDIPVLLNGIRPRGKGDPPKLGTSNSILKSLDAPNSDTVL